jgi:hypothetical protein
VSSSAHALGSSPSAVGPAPDDHCCSHRQVQQPPGDPHTEVDPGQAQRVFACPCGRRRHFAFDDERILTS